MPAITVADSFVAPWTCTKTAANCKYFFVMIAPVSYNDSPFNESNDHGIQALHASYRQLGHYHNDGSDTPLWTIDWYQYDVEPLNDESQT